MNNKYQIDEKFPVQFVWQLPEGDRLRAVFEGRVLHIDQSMNRYVMLLEKWNAGRQESPAGELRPQEAFAKEYWQMVDALAGKTVAIAFEAEDAYPLYMRLETLTGEHNFFTRFDQAVTYWESRRETEDSKPNL